MEEGANTNADTLVDIVGSYNLLNLRCVGLFPPRESEAEPIFSIAVRHHDTGEIKVLRSTLAGHQEFLLNFLGIHGKQ
jgi:hypothetical protein